MINLLQNILNSLLFNLYDCVRKLIEGKNKEQLTAKLALFPSCRLSFKVNHVSTVLLKSSQFTVELNNFRSPVSFLTFFKISVSISFKRPQESQYV